MSEEGRLTVTLLPEISRALGDAVEAGEYGSIDDALADAFATWSHRHEDREEELAWVKARIHASLDDPRPSLTIEEVEAHMKAVFANAQKRRDAAA